MRALLFAAICMASCVMTIAQSPSTDLTLKASDGKTVYARLYPAVGKSRGIVMMFHQAGSNMAEYSTIAPRVRSLGFDCLTIDQRSGGPMWKSNNRTAMKYSADPGYLAAYADLEGALSWAKARKAPRIIAWGSSYSASLVLKLAAEHPEIDRVLAFSPGEYFSNKSMVGSWNARVKCPTLFAFPSSEAMGGGVDLYQKAGKFPGRKKDMMVVNKRGIHGSSTLRADSNPVTNASYWKSVEIFLKN